MTEDADGKPKKKTDWRSRDKLYCPRCSSEWDRHWVVCQRCGQAGRRP